MSEAKRLLALLLIFCAICFTPLPRCDLEPLPSPAWKTLRVDYPNPTSDIATKGDLSGPAPPPVLPSVEQGCLLQVDRKEYVWSNCGEGQTTVTNHGFLIGQSGTTSVNTNGGSLTIQAGDQKELELTKWCNIVFVKGKYRETINFSLETCEEAQEHLAKLKDKPSLDPGEHLELEHLWRSP